MEYWDLNLSYSISPEDYLLTEFEKKYIIEPVWDKKLVVVESTLRKEDAQTIKVLDAGSRKIEESSPARAVPQSIIETPEILG